MEGSACLAVGRVVGCAVGRAVGCAVGAVDGEALGETVGLLLGEEVGACVGTIPADTRRAHDHAHLMAVGWASSGFQPSYYFDGYLA